MIRWSTMASAGTPAYRSCKYCQSSFSVYAFIAWAASLVNQLPDLMSSALSL